MDQWDELRRLQREAGSLVHEPRPAIGADDTGTVEVRVDGAGRIDAVEVHRDWRRRLSPEAVGPAVLAAAGDALTKQATALAVDALRPSPPPRPPAESPGPPPSPHLSRDGPDPRLHELLVTVTDAIGELHAYTEHMEAVATRTTIGRTRSGRVTVTFTGRHLTAVEIDFRWLGAEADGRQIADEVEAACREAYRVIAAEDEAAAARTPHLTAVRDLARDPREFLRRITGD
ncbi:YbaB/EbfC family nucleoid-associated protein [Actinoplanes hulinensis]|uniref:YbaB/EbfC family nucleoid-associated protein n=1 Tax=Actinoplanes hulinensis TaxID=1144547 RepID=A0ABS7AYK4_9ACTN|nr:YbaB/EbfC family nucleoid-associated protein [Actinoplanes hulinensis]MBW6433846.1 YbaB/EbfC family nucleoid-associated protein [Actinoplanes hulinensis]